MNNRSEQNLYAPPKTPVTAVSAAPAAIENGYVACPSCQSANVKRMSFTWWGGAIGPRILHHVKCGDCSHTYNGRSGQSNTKGIIIYSAVVMTIFLPVGYLYGKAFLRW